LVLNLLQNLFYVVTSFSNIILKVPLFGASESLSEQTFNAAFCLLGMPFIFCGFWGVFARVEGQVRMYFFYMLLVLVVDATQMMYLFSTGNICDHLPTILQKHGSAFACGFMRLATIIVVSQVMIIETHFAYTVWSLCEDLKATGGGPGLPELLKTVDEHHSKRRYLAPHGDEHFGGAAGMPVPYGTVGPAAAFGSAPLFGGKAHETNFPPVQRG